MERCWGGFWDNRPSFSSRHPFALCGAVERMEEKGEVGVVAAELEFGLWM